MSNKNDYLKLKGFSIVSLMTIILGVGLWNQYTLIAEILIMVGTIHCWLFCVFLIKLVFNKRKRGQLIKDMLG